MNYNADDPVVELRIKCYDRTVIARLKGYVEEMQKTCWRNVYVREMTASQVRDDFKEGLNDFLRDQGIDINTDVGK